MAGKLYRSGQNARALAQRQQWCRFSRRSAISAELWLVSRRQKKGLWPRSVRRNVRPADAVSWL